MTIEARMAVLVLGIMGITALAGVILLTLFDKSTPDVLQVVIGGCVTGVAGILVPSSTVPNVGEVNGRHER